MFEVWQKDMNLIMKMTFGRKKLLIYLYVELKQMNDISYQKKGLTQHYLWLKYLLR